MLSFAKPNNFIGCGFPGRVPQDVEQAGGQWGCGASPARVSSVQSSHIRSGIPPTPADCQAGSPALELSFPTKTPACSLSVISLEAAL